MLELLIFFFILGCFVTYYFIKIFGDKNSSFLVRVLKDIVIIVGGFATVIIYLTMWLSEFKKE